MPLDPSTLTVSQLWDGYQSIEAQIKSLRSQQALLSNELTLREGKSQDFDGLKGPTQTVKP